MRVRSVTFSMLGWNGKGWWTYINAVFLPSRRHNLPPKLKLRNNQTIRNILDDMWLVVMDAYSKWPHVLKLNKYPTSETTVSALDDLFAIWGRPETIVSDNNCPQFASKTFADWCNAHSVAHLTSAPFHPASNGEAERGHETSCERGEEVETSGFAIIPPAIPCYSTLHNWSNSSWTDAGTPGAVFSLCATTTWAHIETSAGVASQAEIPNRWTRPLQRFHKKSSGMGCWKGNWSCRDENVHRPGTWWTLPPTRISVEVVFRSKTEPPSPPESFYCIRLWTSCKDRPAVWQRCSQICCSATRRGRERRTACSRWSTCVNRRSTRINFGIPPMRRIAKWATSNLEGRTVMFPIHVINIEL